MSKPKPTEKKPETKVHRYYKCPRCGYVTIVKDSFCPVCLKKDGVKIKVK